MMMSTKVFQLVFILIVGVYAEDSTSCNDGWVYHDDKCYLVLNEYQDFFNAQQTCTMFDASLAYGYDENSLNFLNHLVGKYNTYGWWYGAKVRTFDKALMLTTGKLLPASVPRPKQKTFQPPTSGCVGLLKDQNVHTVNYQMVSVPCGVQLPYICRGEPSMLQGSVTSDKDRFVPSTNNDAYWFSDAWDKRSFKDAQKACIEKSMTLVSVRSFMESYNITRQMIRRQNNSVEPWWIGLSVTDGAFKWTSGVPFQPSLAQWTKYSGNMKYYTPPDCRLLLSDGTMDDRFCYISKAPFICYRGTGSTGMFGCPSGWFRAGQSCYHESHANLKQAEAEKMCGKMGAHLISLNTMEEKIWLLDSTLTTDSYSPTFWTSLNDKKTLNNFVWRDGTKPTGDIVTWNTGNIMEGTSKCFVLKGNYKQVGRQNCDFQGLSGCQYKSTNGKCVSDRWAYLNGNCYYGKGLFQSKSKVHYVSPALKSPYQTMLQRCYADLNKHDSTIEISPLKIDDKSILDLFHTRYWNSIWIGLTENDKGVFTWADGTPADLSLFDKKSSRTDNSNERCASVSSHGTFKVQDCECQRCARTICEKEVPFHH